MPFGFISRNELERYHEELREEFAAAVAEQKSLYAKIDLEWTDMFDRFRRLYAKIAKRSVTDEPPVDGAGELPDRPSGRPVAAPTLLQQRRAMRGW